MTKTFVAALLATRLASCSSSSDGPSTAVAAGAGGATGQSSAAGQGGAAGQSGAAGSPSDPTTPSTLSDEPGAAQSTDAVLSVGTKGDVLAGWITKSGTGRTEGRFRTSDDRCASWSPLRTLPAVSHDDVVDVFAFHGAEGQRLLAWQEWTSSSGAISSVSIDLATLAADGTLSPAEVVFEAQGGGIYDLPSAALLDDGTVLMAATLFAPPTFRGSVVVRRAATTAAEVNVSAPKAVGGAALARMCSGSGPLGVAFVEYGPGSKTTQITLQRSSDQGATWPASLTTTVSEPGDALTYAPVDCAADGAGAWVLYQLSDKPDLSTNKDGPHTVALRLAHVAADGTVDRRTNVTTVDEGGQFMTPRLAVGAGGRLDVVYIGGAAVTDPDGSLRVRSSTDGGKSFAAPRTLQTGIALAPGRGGPTWVGDYLGAARDDGALFVAFANNAGGAAHVQVVRAPLSVG